MGAVSFPFGETVEFVSGVEVEDEYHNQTTDWDHPEVVLTCYGVGVEPRPSSETTTDARNAITSGFTIYIPDEMVEVRGEWRANVRGSQWQVLGDSSQWRHPMTGWVSGTVVQVGRVDG